MEKWKPINYKGHWNYDPRGELRLRAQVAKDNYDSYVAIPVALAMACAELTECSATTILKGDEDGPFKEPIVVRCRKMNGHDGEFHDSGGVAWKA